MVEMSVDSHDTSSDLSPVLNGGSVNVSVASLEKLGDPCSREVMLVDRLVNEQQNVPHLGGDGLVLPDHVEPTPGEFLDPLGVED